MHLQFFPPHPALSDLIEAYIYSEVPAGTSLYALPSNGEQLSINLKGKGTAKRNDECEERGKDTSYLIGIQNAPVLFGFTEQAHTITVNFKAGGIHRLLHLPMRELLGKCIPAKLLMDASIRSLEEQLKNCPDKARLTGILDDFFLSRLPKLGKSHPVDEVMHQVVQYPDEWTKVGDMASVACTSIRQFERQCLLRYGVSPKYYLRVSRFNKALRLKNQHPGLSWTEVAAITGYFDQNHLIKDFKSLGAGNPSDSDPMGMMNLFPKE